MFLRGGKYGDGSVVRDEAEHDLVLDEGGGGGVAEEAVAAAAQHARVGEQVEEGAQVHPPSGLRDALHDLAPRAEAADHPKDADGVDDDVLVEEVAAKEKNLSRFRWNSGRREGEGK